MKELLIYSGIWSYTASEFIKALEDNKDKEVTVRINCRGGDTQQAFGMIAKFAEHKQKKNIKVDAFADSMAAFFLCFANGGKKTCLDVSSFTFHRASYGEWIESNALYMTEAMWGELDRINGFLRKAMEATVDVAKFEKITGVTIDQLFDNATRIDVTITAEQAKQIGLIDEIVAITPEISAEINSMNIRIAAESTGVKEVNPPAANTLPAPPITTTNSLNNKKMTAAEFKANHPEAYAEILKAGATAERDRINAWRAWEKVDAEAVKKGIESGEMISAAQTQEFTVKAISVNKLGKLAAEATTEVTTTEDEGKTPEETTAQAFKDAVKANLKNRNTGVKA